VGALAEDLQGEGHDPRRLIVFAQNHDQVGNRATGDRLPPDALKVAAAVTLFSSCSPLILHGEEYLEQRPFSVLHGSHRSEHRRSDAAGTEARVRDVRLVQGATCRIRRPSRRFSARSSSRAEPDPLYRELLALRRTLPRELEIVEADDAAKRLHLRRGMPSSSRTFARSV